MSGYLLRYNPGGGTCNVGLNYKNVGPPGPQGPPGPPGPPGGGTGSGITGPPGPTGPVTSYIFDGGTAGSSYILGPAFDCGSST